MFIEPIRVELFWLGGWILRQPFNILLEFFRGHLAS